MASQRANNKIVQLNKSSPAMVKDRFNLFIYVLKHVLKLYLSNHTQERGWKPSSFGKYPAQDSMFSLVHRQRFLLQRSSLVGSVGFI
jgi:hypothetical protein